MNDILEEFDKYISSNKEVLSVLPINTKKNRTAYVKKVDEMLEKAVQIKEVIWNEIVSRYERYIIVEENPEVAKLQKEVFTNNIYSSWRKVIRKLSTIRINFIMR